MFKKKYYLLKNSIYKEIDGFYEDIFTLLGFIGITPITIEKEFNFSLLLELGMLTELEQELEELREQLRNKNGKLVVIDPYDYRVLKLFFKNQSKDLDIILLQDILKENMKKLPIAEQFLKINYFPTLPERELGKEKSLKQLLSFLGFDVNILPQEVSGAEPFMMEISLPIARKIAKDLGKDRIITTSPLIYMRLSKLIPNAQLLHQLILYNT